MAILTNRAARRVDAVEAFTFPAGARHALAARNPGFDQDGLRLAETATRQWFRLLARRPRARLAVPSVVVNDLWRDVVAQTTEYAALCAAAFGRPPYPRPDDRNGPGGDPAALLATLRLAREDGGHGPGDLPLLFRVDGDVGLPGATRYLADCGGRGHCFEAPGMICLQHLPGPGRRFGPRGVRGMVVPGHDGRYGYVGGAGVGERFGDGTATGYGDLGGGGGDGGGGGGW